ncbi:GDSL-type esterase/lipase family protein [Limibacter armeniacum]|uniref:GDSL-type esterase/lipase family protein n=1 Tax=Limibacter armeniacum TaxID=466084 RepID=UPI002FE6BE8F
MIKDLIYKYKNRTGKLPKRIKVLPFALILCAAGIPSINPLNNHEDSAVKLQKDYDFIRRDINYFQTFGQNNVLTHFLTQLRLLEVQKDRKVHVLHLGDSHIQADFFSGRIRELLYKDNRFPMSSRGFVFPYRAAHTNNPLNYRNSYTGKWTGKRSSMSSHSSRWGAAGISASTFSTSSTLKFDPNVDVLMPYDIKHVKVFYPNQDPAQFDVKVRPTEGNLIVKQDKGDGVIEFTLDKPQKDITLTLEKKNQSQKRFVMQGVLLESDQPGLTYSAAGVNGAMAKSFARCADFAKQVEMLKPDLVVVSLGTNDAFIKPFNVYDFKKYYTSMLKEIKAAAPNASILLTTPGDSYRYSKYLNHDNEEARLAIGEMAREYGAAVWDFYTVMGGLNAMDYWLKNDLASKDRIHLSQKGYEYQGELFYRALDKAYNTFADTVTIGTLSRFDGTSSQ